MKGLLKMVGGLVIGAAVGAGAYLLLSNDNEEGIVSDIKSLVNEVVEEGKRAAEERRAELELELAGDRSNGQLI